MTKLSDVMTIDCEDQVKPKIDVREVFNGIFGESPLVRLLEEIREKEELQKKQSPD